MQVHLAFKSGKLNFAVAGAQVDFALARHLDDDMHAMIAPAELQIVVWIAYFDIDGIAGLMLLDANAALANLVARGDDLGFDRVLIPSGDAYVRVRGIDAKVRLAADVVRL